MAMSPAASKEESGSTSNGKKLRVLVVDDQLAVCEVVADSIAYAGHEIVGKGKDGVEAVSLAKELRPDLVVMERNRWWRESFDPTCRFRRWVRRPPWQSPPPGVRCAKDKACSRQSPGFPQILPSAEE